ncbi:MAG TPA: hypothetical protein GXX42_11880 [Petrimonas sp.]|uniref:hypothetical protein n=1 Tax=Petrimonas sp. TaxID=2023866 RepID=UPI000961581C|nr:MAG: hypothetical protein BGO33_13820 [Bacteroidia bacterium 43-41]HHV86494.1 hypothetical protein [Petrimonas sp.]
MRKIIIHVIIVCSFLLYNASSCYKESDDCHRYIHFTNNSGRDIYYQFNIFDEISEYNPALSPSIYTINKNQYKRLRSTTSFTCFESIAEEGKGNIFLFLFDSDAVKSLDWETVRENDMYLKKYVLTIEELNKMNWKIIFTGE